MTPRPAAPGSPGRAQAALAIDATEWFHDPAFAGHLSARHWRRLPMRALVAIEAAAALCARHGARATFFVSSAMAERWPELLQRLVRDGHEVASAGHEPVDLAAVPATARETVLMASARARQAIEAATGQRVRGFRSPWPTTGGVPWWREALAAAGYDYDATESVGEGELQVHVFGGGKLVATRFAASLLDAEQPRLEGLPRALRRAHYARLDGAAHRIGAMVSARQFGSIAATLQLPVQAVSVSMPTSMQLAAAVPVAGAPRVAIVVPMKDEEAGMPSLLVELDALSAHLRTQAACEFVFVDDGSTDRTWSLLQERLAGRANVRLVQHAQNAGLAAAIATGIRAADAPVVVSIDADLSYDPMELGAMLALLDGADLVTASPYHPRGSVRNVPGWRLALSRTLSGCYRRLLHSPVHTWTSCFRVYRRAAVVDLPLENPGFLGTAELLVRLLRRGGRVREHPCELQARLFGQSKMRVLRTIGGHLRLMWRVLRGRIS